MRLYVIPVVLLFLALIAVSVCDYVSCVRTLVKKADSLRKEYQTKYFIAESFCNTCNGKGFSNLEEWQVSCRQMFNLEYIAWCLASDFMIDDYHEEGHQLMYGKWIAVQESGEISGEIYCRM